MSSFLSNLPEFPIPNIIRIVVILLVALVANRLLRLAANLLVKTAEGQTRAAQAREQQTRMLADGLYGILSKCVWTIALLLVAQEFGIGMLPVVVLAGLIAVAVGFGAQNAVRDTIAGFYIILEDQFVVGDTIQTNETAGRVEHLSIRRTVVRDTRGALVTIANGEIRAVGNLSRDWSQAFVDVAVSAHLAQEKALQVLDAAATGLREDPMWSQALVDGPRILGLQSFDQTASVLRLQVRTAPARHEDVARELRRRVQLEFQRQGIPLSDVQRVELVRTGVPAENTAEVPYATS
jgi:moderate conductance mechanosensitive channel